MDIDLFSDIVRDLILDNDEVTLPGLGTFVSEVVPSTFSDKGYTINPPYRRLSFRQRWNEGDTLLVDFYSQANGIDKEQSAKILSDFISGLKETLQAKKVVPMPGLGRLRATKENTFFFIADEDLDIYPYGFGLEPVSLKTHEETPEEITAAVQALSLQSPEPSEPVAMPSEHPEPSEPVAMPSEHSEPSVAEQPWQPESSAVHVEKQEQAEAKDPVNWAFVIPLCIILAVALFFVGFIVLSKLAPAFIDSLLYTPEELRIINYPLS